MSNPNAVAAADAPMKTPGYAWPCLIVSLLCAVSIVFAWQWLPGVTFPVFSGWEAGINPTFQAPMMADVHPGAQMGPQDGNVHGHDPGDHRPGHLLGFRRH